MWSVINAGLMVLCIDLDETAKYRLSTRPSPALLFILKLGSYPIFFQMSLLLKIF